MKRIGIYGFIGIFLLIWVSYANASAVPVWDSPAKNYLTGINGLVIGSLGTYDVSFQFDSYDDIWGNDTPTFWDSDGSDAVSARSSIIAFLNLPDIGAPFVTGSSSGASVFSVPFAIDASTSKIVNKTGLRSTDIGIYWKNRSTNYKVTSSSDETYAVFSAVPIPGAIWLLGSGLIGIVGIRRKVKK